MMVMATPCDYREMGFMSNMFAEGRLDADYVTDQTGLVPARALDEGFQTLKPERAGRPAGQLLENLWNDEFVEGFLAISQWARDQVPFPGAAFRQTVSLLIRQNALLAGVIPLGRREARLKDIRCPFLNAFAEQDGITRRVLEPLTGLVGSADAGELAFGPAISASSPGGRRSGSRGRRSRTGSGATATRFSPGRCGLTSPSRGMG